MRSRHLVGGRILKTSIAVGLSIFIAQSLGLERVTLAAIVAMVTIQRTFYRSVMLSAAKMGSVLLGAVLGTLFGYLLGGTPIAYGLVTMTVIMCCLWLNWQDNIGITAVVAIGTMSSEAASLTAYSVLSFFSAAVGGVVALSVNYLFAPDHKDVVRQRVQDIESSLRDILEIVARAMLHPDKVCEDFTARAEALKIAIKDGLELSKLFREEQKFHLEAETLADRYRDVFRVFASQTERLVEMHGLACRMVVEVPQAVPISRLLRVVGKAQRRRLEGKPEHLPLIGRAIKNLDTRFELMELPSTRAEFISRASLVHLFFETKRYYRRIQDMPPVIDKEPMKRAKRKIGGNSEINL